ncbi:MAG TPA: glyoxalase [Gammaproteobacteria bacterium]|nr:glyoxalase [Gammaproteobacteria bacterium]
MFKSILHCSLIVSSTEESLHFYHHILGMDIDHSRPELGYPGAWLNVGEQQIHLLEVDNPDPTQQRPQHGGRDRHVALDTNQLDKLITRLEANNIRFTLSRSGRKALFFRDPDGNTIEAIQS